jgi:hypothetical protein
MDTLSLLTAEVKDTLGYSESKDKESFMTGAYVAIYKTRQHYSTEIEQLKTQINSYKSMYEETSKDLKTIASIIRQYSTD